MSTPFMIGDSPFVKKLQRNSLIFLLFGAVAMFAAMATSGNIGALKVFLAGYLLGFIYFMGIGATAMFFSTLMYLFNAGWASVIRRIAEILSFFVKIGVPILILPILGFAGIIYHEWMHPEGYLEHMMQHGFKGVYLNTIFFYIRIAVYLILWFYMHTFIVGNSIKQDTATDATPTQKNWKRAAPFAIIYALTISFISFDLVMSLEPHWFSTIFGVYCFAGHWIATICTMLIFTYTLNNGGYFKNLISREHFHDLGKLMFAFTIFWAYISFSQYFIIWYGNLPEETIFYTKRLQGGWQIFGWASLFIHFVAPFLFLIRQDIKRKPKMLVYGSILLLVGHFIDLCWVILPAFGGHGEETHFTPALLTSAIGGVFFIGGIFLYIASMNFKKYPIVAYNDPYLHESIDNLSGAYDR